MSLQIRRGTNQERLNFTPVEGEVIYVTDSQLVFANVTDIASNILTCDDEHHLTVGITVKFIGNTPTTGQAGFGLTEATTYYVKTVPTTSSFTLSTTLNGSTLTLTGGSGASLHFAITPRNLEGNPTGYNIAPIWVGDGQSVGGIAAGAATLDELADVTIGVSGLYGITLDSNQHLQYDGVTNQWRNVNNVIIPGTLLVQSGTNSTSKDTGAVIVGSGGLGVEGNVFAGGALDAATYIDAGTYVNAATTVTAGTNVTATNGFVFAGTSLQSAGGIVSTTSTGTATVFNTNATTVNIGGAASTVNIGASGGNVVVTGDLEVNGNDIKSSDGVVAITLSGNDVSMPDKLTVGNEIVLNGTQPFVSFFRATPVDTAETVRGVRGSLTVDDYWFVGGGATGDDAGYLLLATSDNSATTGLGEPILVRQYGGSGLTYPTNAPWGADAPITREAKLFDENGYTVFPERLGVGITPTIKLDVNGSARIRGDSLTVDGDLIVNGTTTTINSTTLTVDDKNIEIGSVATPSDATADGGGIILKGATDKTILWDSATTRWVSNVGFNSTAARIGNVSIADSTNDNTITTTTGNLLLNAATGLVQTEVAMQIDGNLDVIGQLHFHDNFPVLNYGVTGAPSTNAGISVNRGTSADVNFRWNETTDRWGSTVDGTNYIDLPNQALDTGNTPTFAGATLGNITVGVATDGTITTSTGGLAITAANSTIDITGDTTVIGNFRTTDNIIRFNYGVETGTPTSGTAGIAVRRGDASDANWIWDEQYDWWTGRLADNTATDIYSSGRVIAHSDLATNGRNIIFNNDDAVPVDADNMTLLVKRGTSADVSIVWDETANRWKSTSDGTNYFKFPNQDLDTGNDVVFASAAIGNISIANSTTDNTLTTSTGNLILNAASGVVAVGCDMTGTNLTLSGNLTVNGTTTTINTEEINLADNIVRINSNATGTPSQNGGIEIERGDETNVNLLWDETSDRWKTTVDGTNYLNLPNQSLDVTSTVTFNKVNLDGGRVALDTNSLTTTTTTANQVLDTFDLATYRTVKYVIQATSSGAGCHVMECLVMHDGTTAYITTYGEMFSDSSLTTVGAVVSGANVELQVTPTNAATVYKVTKTLISA